MHPLNEVLPLQYVPVRVTRGALAHIGILSLIRHLAAESSSTA